MKNRFSMMLAIMAAGLGLHHRPATPRAARKFYLTGEDLRAMAAAKEKRERKAAAKAAR